jgi:hypothetical protein
MPRFVILEHDFPEVHWDLMLEAETVLRTWRLERSPEAGQAVKAEKSFDHRIVYLDYEGPISGGRGQVRRWDAGTFQFELDGPNQIVLHLMGECVRGRAELSRTPQGGWVFCLT